jgi:hypothetical protein
VDPVVTPRPRLERGLGPRTDHRQCPAGLRRSPFGESVGAGLALSRRKAGGVAQIAPDGAAKDAAKTRERRGRR